MSTPQTYTLLASRFGHPIGTTVYEQLPYDYGLAYDDTCETGIEHISVTLRPDGGYPGFTVPVRDLQPVDTTTTTTTTTTA